MRITSLTLAASAAALGPLVMFSGMTPASAHGLESAARTTYGPVTYPGTLMSVSAASASDVWAVGFHDDSNEFSTTLIEHWDGHFWGQVASPRLGGAGGSQLYGVSAVTATDAWAVGNYYTGTEFDTLIEHWDGKSWSQVPSPSPGGSSGSYLFSVSALSANDAWAVGRTYQGPLIEHWNGTTWSQVASPGRVGTSLSGVSAVSAADAFAVGNTFGAFSRPFLLQWDGTSWKRSPSVPDKRGHGDEVNGVSASSATDAWAVGTTTTYRHVITSPLIKHWDGAGWQPVTGLNPGGRFGTWLAGVSALSSSDVWAVGSYGVSRGGLTRTFVEHWDGQHWKKTHTASPGSNRVAVVNGVDALSASRAWTAGSYVDGTYRTMTMNWDGSRWIQL